MSISTLLGTNISTTKALLKMIFLIPRWDMLVHWRVSTRGWRLLESPLPCPPAFLLGAPNPPGAAGPGILHCALPSRVGGTCANQLPEVISMLFKTLTCLKRCESIQKIISFGPPNKIPIIWIEDHTILSSKVTVGSKSFIQS